MSQCLANVMVMMKDFNCENVERGYSEMCDYSEVAFRSFNLCSLWWFSPGERL